MIALIGVGLVIALIGPARLAGAEALLWTALRIPDQIALHLTISDYAAMALPVICFTVMLLAPPRRAGDGLGWLVGSLSVLTTRRLRWLTVSVVISVVIST